MSLITQNNFFYRVLSFCIQVSPFEGISQQHNLCLCVCFGKGDEHVSALLPLVPRTTE
jgi:hypothetical protein